MLCYVMLCYVMLCKTLNKKMYTITPPFHANLIFRGIAKAVLSRHRWRRVGAVSFPPLHPDTARHRARAPTPPRGPSTVNYLSTCIAHSTVPYLPFQMDSSRTVNHDHL